jgi:type I restriction enzyme R subunit
VSDVGQRERPVQDRVVLLFADRLGYRYLGNRQYRPGNANIEQEDLRTWLRKRGTSETLITRALHRLTQAAALGEGRTLYEANREVYGLLRYGAKVREAAGEPNQTVRLIDWEKPEHNDFAVAEEVTVFGQVTKRPDVVLYVNGIALGVLELKRSIVSVGEGIRQNLGNQKKEVIGPFFTTAQLMMAGNDTEGLRYGTIETAEKYYLQWREEGEEPNLLDRHLMQLCNKARLLEIVHDFIVFDSGTKKICRHNQYFGVRKAQDRVRAREGGIIWHTQGSGKSLTMVWLAKWIRENVRDSRVLIVTDRTELDEQIEKVFKGVDENIHRTKKRRRPDLGPRRHKPLADLLPRPQVRPHGHHRRGRLRQGPTAEPPRRLLRAGRAVRLRGRVPPHAVGRAAQGHAEHPPQRHVPRAAWLK